MPLTAPANPESVVVDGAPQLTSGTAAADEIGSALARTPAALGAPQRIAGTIAVPTGPMRDNGTPDGVGAVGCTGADVADPVAGAATRQRLPATAPEAVTGDDLAGIPTRSLSLW